MPRYLALCPRPTEPLCAKELSALPGVSQVEVQAGAVSFHGSLEALYRANLWLRCATRVLLPLGDFPCGGPDDLYQAALGLPWEAHLHKTGTLAVSAHGEGPGLDNSMFTALRVKDAVVDRFRDRFGVRPDVRRDGPDLAINVQLYRAGSGEPRCALSVDSSEQPLHCRGYRKEASAAPLKETLAAAIVQLAGYEGGTVLDLMCGGGTLVIEAGLRALRRAPGLHRGFGFQRWRDYDAPLFRRLLEEAQAAVLQVPGEPFLYGSDFDQRMARAAQDNAGRAGISRWARFVGRDLADVRPPPGPAGVILCNPPYGERLGEENELIPLYRTLGDVFKRHFTGWRAYVFTANLRLGRQIGLRPKGREVLYNGPLEGRLLRFDLY